MGFAGKTEKRSTGQCIKCGRIRDKGGGPCWDCLRCEFDADGNQCFLLGSTEYGGRFYCAWHDHALTSREFSYDAFSKWCAIESKAPYNTIWQKRQARELWDAASGRDKLPGSRWNFKGA